LKRVCPGVPAKDILQLLKLVIFNFVIGNHAAHGKNFSLLYIDNTVKLAPAYDLLCTDVYPGLSNKQAMKIGGLIKREIFIAVTL
jgi:serine/threonine-protein kinase HipA